MQDYDLFDFMVFSEMLFPEDPDRTIECPFCGTKIEGDERVRWLDRDKNTFQCPDCDREIKID